MKRWIATLGVMLLMPTLAMAQGEMVSISELRRQSEQMGRWKEKYDTPNGEVSVDVPNYCAGCGTLSGGNGGESKAVE